MMLLRPILYFLLVALLVSQSVLAAEGDLAADFSLPVFQENAENAPRIKLSDYHGKVVLLDFWASWCGPCRASFPSYDRLRAKVRAAHGEDHFEILAVNVDMNKDEGLAFLQQYPVGFVVLDETTGGSTQRQYDLLVMPTSFLIDQQGVIRLQHAGFSEAYVTLLEREIGELLAVSAANGRGAPVRRE